MRRGLQMYSAAGLTSRLAPIASPKEHAFSEALPFATCGNTLLGCRPPLENHKIVSDLRWLVRFLWALGCVRPHRTPGARRLPAWFAHTFWRTARPAIEPPLWARLVERSDAQVSECLGWVCVCRCLTLGSVATALPSFGSGFPCLRFGHRQSKCINASSWRSVIMHTQV